MGKIKKILENELVGGTQTTDVYPVTSVKAVYDENNERLDHILNRRGVVNISTNYNSDHIAEVLTLDQAIAKVPTSDRVLGFQGEYLASDGWHTVVYIGESLTTWSNSNNWIDFPNKIFKSISRNATFAGIATPTTNPGAPDGNVFYIATQAGTYTNFGGVTLNEGLNILRWNGSVWALTNVMTIAQELGTSQTAVMSQKATTEAINQVNSSTGVDEYPTFSESMAYSAGDVVNYNGKLYQFIVGHAAGAWTGMDVEPYNLKKDIEERYGTYTDNPEFIATTVDNEGKVLFGIKVDGSPYYPNNEMYHVIQNEEYLAAWVDANNKILFGIKTDGSIYIAKSEYINAVKEKIESLSDSVQPLTESFQTTDNPEFIATTVDNEGKVLECTLSDGKKFFPKQALLDKYDDVEGRTEITLDTEDRVLAYRDKEGIKHEEKLALNEVYDKDNNKINLATKEDVENVTVDPSSINISELKGVSDHNTPNLLIADEMQKTFNDGINSFTPPNVGYEMSNPIECQAGDWFTRTGIATGMVVVTDENDKNGTRLFNADGTTLPNTFQIPKNMPWVRYIRMAASKTDAENGDVVICKGKNAYTGDSLGDYLTVDKLRVEDFNIPKDIKYLKSSDGKYWELYVDDSHQLQIREIDPDIITELPSDFKTWTLNGTFDGQFDRFTIQNSYANPYFIDLKAGGVVKYKKIGNNISFGNYSNFEHFYTESKEDRYGFIFTSSDDVIGRGFTLFDGDFNILDTNIGITGYGTGVSDIHDFVYINDNHIILYTHNTATVSVPGFATPVEIEGPRICELKKQQGEWKVVGEFKATDYPQLCTDAFGDLGEDTDVMDDHTNTVTLDYDNNLIINCRNWDTFIKIKRVENLDGTVTLGSKILDYSEAIIGRVGGRHNSAYLDSKRVLNEGFSFTDVPASLNDMSDDEWEEWQWYHSHDVKYWGMKQIGDKQYPTYTLFDNNMWTEKEFISRRGNIVNKHNNIDINPVESSGSYTRIIQISIDWENHLVKDYRVYYIPGKYSSEQGGCTMHDEGKISIAYSYIGEFGLWDFTTEDTEVNGKIYKGAKELFKGKYNPNTNCYRANTYTIFNI